MYRSGSTLVAVVVFICAAAVTADEAPRVSFEEGRLSVDFRDVPAGKGFREIERHTNLRIEAPPSVRGKRLTVRFQKLDLERGMKQIIRSLDVKDFAVLYSRNEGDAVYRLIGEEDAVGQTDGGPRSTATFHRRKSPGSRRDGERHHGGPRRGSKERAKAD